MSRFLREDCFEVNPTTFDTATCLTCEFGSVKNVRSSKDEFGATATGIVDEDGLCVWSLPEVAIWKFLERTSKLVGTSRRYFSVAKQKEGVSK